MAQAYSSSTQESEMEGIPNLGPFLIKDKIWVRLWVPALGWLKQEDCKFEVSLGIQGDFVSKM